MQAQRLEPMPRTSTLLFLTLLFPTLFLLTLRRQKPGTPVRAMLWMMAPPKSASKTLMAHGQCPQVANCTTVSTS